MKLSLTADQQATARLILAWMADDDDFRDDAKRIVVAPVGLSEAPVDAWGGFVVAGRIFSTMFARKDDRKPTAELAEIVDGRVKAFVAKNPLPVEVAAIVAKPGQRSLFE